MPHPDTWLKVLPDGLFCEPGGFHVDPVCPVERAIITHAHADHARPGHGAALASPETLALMDVRMGEGRAGGTMQALPYGERLRIGEVTVWTQPAGHVLGSAQVAMEWRGSRAVVSGDYKRAADPTCLPFEPIPCDVFVTEATFGLPVFQHPPAEEEVRRLLDSVALFPGRTHVVGCYALGKCQRLIALLRRAGWDRPIYLHGALMALCRAYERMGVPLGELRPATVAARAELAGAIVLAPPSAIADRWARRLAEPVVGLASGWMRVRQRARARGVELPLVVSDHADWAELNQTLDDVGAPEVWVTHGSEEALIHEAAKRGIRGRALRLIGYGDEEAGGEDAAAPGEEADGALAARATRKARRARGGAGTGAGADGSAAAEAAAAGSTEAGMRDPDARPDALPDARTTATGPAPRGRDAPDDAPDQGAAPPGDEAAVRTSAA